MERMKVLCPVTGRSERVSVDQTPCGTVIAGCSRFIPPDNVHCGGTCAAALDRSLQCAPEHRAERVLVVYTNAQHTESIARQLGALLSFDGLVVDYADADLGKTPPPEDYDAVIVGISPRFLSRLPRSITSYIADHRRTLQGLPNFLFLVGGVAAKELELLAERTGWIPRGVATYARPQDAGMPDIGVLRAFAHAIGDAVPATELTH
jgi:Flavodoxin domain